MSSISTFYFFHNGGFFWWRHHFVIFWKMMTSSQKKCTQNCKASSPLAICQIWLKISKNLLNSIFGHVTLSRRWRHGWTPVVMTNFLISPKWPQINCKKSRQSTYLKELHFWSAKQKITGGGSKSPPRTR